MLFCHFNKTTLRPCLPLQDLWVSGEQLRGHYAKIAEVHLLGSDTNTAIQALATEWA